MLNLRIRRLMQSLTALALAAAIVAPSTGLARIYKWTDEDGNTVYSQSPPPRGVQSERIEEARPPAEDPEATMESLRERTEAFEERRQARQDAEQEDDAAEEREALQQQVCEQLRKNLQVMQNNNQVRQRSDDGEYEALSEEQRQARIASTQKRIEKECSD